jgi:hypothetical protein
MKFLIVKPSLLPISPLLGPYISSESFYRILQQYYTLKTVHTQGKMCRGTVLSITWFIIKIKLIHTGKTNLDPPFCLMYGRGD